MAAPLPPRVSGPLTTQSRVVVVEGVQTGADVTVFADGDDVGSGPAAFLGGPLVGLGMGGASFTRVTLSTRLEQGQRVTAEQSLGGATSRRSTVPVVVIGVPSQLPIPDVRTFPVTGVEAMLARQLFPGAEVTVRVIRGGVSSTKTVDVDDFQEVVPAPSPLRTGDSLQVIQRLGSVATGWSAPERIEPWGESEKAFLPTPVFELVPQACDRGIRLGNLVPGATAVVELNGDELRRRTVVNRTVVPVRSYIMVALDDEPLAEGDQLVIWQEFPATGQRTDPNESLIHTVGPAAPPARPVLWSGICPQSSEIVVVGYRPGAKIRIYQAAPGSTSFTLRDDLTHRAPLLEPDVIPVAAPFPSGGQVVATQDPCHDTESPMSFPVKVTSLDTLQFAPTWISEPVVECASGVVANNLLLGVSASIWSAALGGPITPSRPVMNPLPNWFDALILPGDKLRLVQSGCVAPPAVESAAVPVQPANGLPPALDYVFGGDRWLWVWCSAEDAGGNVVAANGALVEAFITRFQRRHWVGSARSSGDGWAQILLNGWTIQNDDEVTVTARLCGDPIPGAAVVAIPPRPPRQPILVAPSPGSTTTEDHPVFEWKDPDAGTAYEALSFTFGIVESGPGAWILPPVHTENNSHSWSGAPTLLAGRSYRWFVAPEGRRGKGMGTHTTVTIAVPPSPPKPPPPLQGGFSKLVVWNCNSSWQSHQNGGTVIVYMRDRTSGIDFRAIGTLDVGYPESGGNLCGFGYSSGEEYELEDGHVYDFVFVDPELPGCDGDPNTVACGRLPLYGVVGRDDGPVLARKID